MNPTKALTILWLSMRFPGQKNRFRVVGYDPDNNSVRIEDKIGSASGAVMLDVDADFMNTDCKLMETLQ